jgi:hypothetical protein
MAASLKCKTYIFANATPVSLTTVFGFGNERFISNGLLRAATVNLPVTVHATASGDTLLIPAPGAAQQIRVISGSVHNRATTLSPVVSLRAGANPFRWSAKLAPNGGDVYFTFADGGWPLAPNLPLNVNLAAAGDVDVNITEFVLEDL